MFIPKSFAGLESVGSGPETEPKSSETMKESTRLLIMEAYNLSDAIVAGATVNYESILNYLQTGNDSEPFIQLAGEPDPEVAYYTNNSNHLNALKEVRDQMAKESIQITDGKTFIESFQRAVEDGDQNNLE